MLTTKRRICKIGNSCGIVLDRVIKEVTNIKKGDEVEISYNENEIIIKKTNNRTCLDGKFER